MKGTAGLLWVHLLAQLALVLAGAGFEDSFLTSFWHFPDPLWLRREPLATLAALHGQPPVYALVLLIAAWLPGAWASFFLALFHNLAGLALGLATRALARRLGAGRRAAWIAGALILVHPEVLLHERLVFYELPAAALLAWTLALTGSRAAAGLGTALVLLRSLFHPVWGL
ncbi:MAG TPA: phospholipid carrier-dependent glycosyltransferase, partial [Bdellovibrionota bacterium]|nr:phospholipid carrier-dependent glycosyltransferase [Bdellovibrionota bacterium]